jgi:hypothetical protein
MTTIVVASDTEAALESVRATARAGDLVSFATAGAITLSHTLLISNSITRNGLVGGSATVTLQRSNRFIDVTVTGGTVVPSHLSISGGMGTRTTGAAGTAALVQGRTGGTAAGAVFNAAGSVTFIDTATHSATSTVGGAGGSGGSGGTGVSDPDPANGGIKGQSRDGLGGLCGASGGMGGLPGLAGTACSTGTGQNSLGGIGSARFASAPVAMPCFATGVRILTPEGYIAVENLAEGGRVVTFSGATRPIIWLGHRRVDLVAHAAPDAVTPIRVQAHAFGPNLPLRPVILSAEHAIYMLGVLVPVSALVNGTSVAPVLMRAVTYWHVELDAHDAILADGLPCESYLDTGNRMDFQGDQVVTLHPMLEAARARFAALRQFAPIHRQGETVEQVRDILWRFDAPRTRFGSF